MTFKEDMIDNQMMRIWRIRADFIEPKIMNPPESASSAKSAFLSYILCSYKTLCFDSMRTRKLTTFDSRVRKESHLVNISKYQQNGNHKKLSKSRLLDTNDSRHHNPLNGVVSHWFSNPSRLWCMASS